MTELQAAYAAIAFLVGTLGGAAKVIHYLYRKGEASHARELAAERRNAKNSALFLSALKTLRAQSSAEAPSGPHLWADPPAGERATPVDMPSRWPSPSFPEPSSPRTKSPRG